MILNSKRYDGTNRGLEMATEIKKDVKKILSRVWFTELDNEVSGSSQRDPLGLQSIWAYYGGRVIKHITTVSNDIRGFRETLLCLDICSKYQNEKNDDRYSYKELILCFEELFIYSAIKKDKENHTEKARGLIGYDNGRSKFESSRRNPVISPQNTVLASQISLGYYGRYKTPLYSMSIINGMNRVHSKFINVPSLYGDIQYQELYKAFKIFMDKRSVKTFDSFTGVDYMVDAVCGPFREGEKEFWLERLQVSGKDEDILMRECYERLSEDNTPEQLLSALREHPEVNDILCVEPYLLCVEEVFYKMLSNGNVSAIKFDSEKHYSRLQEFKSASKPERPAADSLSRKYNLLLKLDPHEETYLYKIYEYHKKVCEYKGSGSWLNIENDSIQQMVQMNVSVDLDEWNRNYYLRAFKDIKDSIKRIENGE